MIPLKIKKYLTEIEYISGLPVTHRPLITFALVQLLHPVEENMICLGPHHWLKWLKSVFSNPHFSAPSPLLFLLLG